MIERVHQVLAMVSVQTCVCEEYDSNVLVAN